MYLFPILKFTPNLLSFVVLGGFSFAVYSGLAIELLYPEIINDYWEIWWKGWLFTALVWFLLKSKKANERRFRREWLRSFTSIYR